MHRSAAMQMQADAVQELADELHDAIGTERTTYFYSSASSPNFLRRSSLAQDSGLAVAIGDDLAGLLVAGSSKASRDDLDSDAASSVSLGASQSQLVAVRGSNAH